MGAHVFHRVIDRPVGWTRRRAGQTRLDWSVPRRVGIFPGFTTAQVRNAFHRGSAWAADAHSAARAPRRHRDSALGAPPSSLPVQADQTRHLSDTDCPSRGVCRDCHHDRVDRCPSWRRGQGRFDATGLDPGSRHVRAWESPLNQAPGRFGDAGSLNATISSPFRTSTTSPTTAKWFQVLPSIAGDFASSVKPSGVA